MSLLKLRRTEELGKLPTEDELEKRFAAELDNYIVEPSVEALAEVITTYSNYSYIYLLNMSETLEPNDYGKSKMIIFNSIIAELCNDVGVLYFDREHGYSIIDKSVAYVVDNGVQDDTQFVLDVIEEMNKVEEVDCELVD